MATVAFCSSLVLPLSDNTPPPRHHRLQTRRRNSSVLSPSLSRCHIPGKIRTCHSVNNVSAKARPRPRIICQATDRQQSKESSDIEFGVTVGQDRLLKVIFPSCLCVLLFLLQVALLKETKRLRTFHKCGSIYLLEAGKNGSRGVWTAEEKEPMIFFSLYFCLKDGMELAFISLRIVVPNATFHGRNRGSHLVPTYRTGEQVWEAGTSVMARSPS